MDVKKFIKNGRVMENFLKAFLTPIQRRLLKMQARKTLIKSKQGDGTKRWESVDGKTTKELNELFYNESSSEHDEVCLLDQFYKEHDNSGAF